MNSRKDALHCPNCDSVYDPYLRVVWIAEQAGLMMTCGQCGQSYEVAELMKLVESEKKRA